MGFVDSPWLFAGGPHALPLAASFPQSLWDLSAVMGSWERLGALRGFVGSPHLCPPPRFLVHRYSVLRQHAEASGAEGLETADPPSPPYKGGYHDDSDEVSPPPHTHHEDPPPGLGSLQ